MTSAGLPKVLVVDDEGDIRELLRATLARAGCALLFAGSGQEALAVARRELPAVILLDVVMPDALGWDVLRELKADPSTRPARVLMLTGLARKAVFKVAFELGADGFLNKPFTPAEVLQRVQDLLKLSAKMAAAEALAEKEESALSFLAKNG